MSEPVISDQVERRFSWSPLAYLEFLILSIAFLWVADLIHYRFDDFSTDMIDLLLRPIVLMLFVVHFCLAIIMVIKGPANGLESSLIRFMISKSIFWGWLYFLTLPRPLTQYLALVMIVGIATLDVFVRMVNYYIWPIVEVFVPTRVTCWYEKAKDKVLFCRGCLDVRRWKWDRLIFWRRKPA